MHSPLNSFGYWTLKQILLLLLLLLLCLADICTSEVHPVFNPVASYGYLLSDMYLFMADTTNPDSFV